MKFFWLGIIVANSVALVGVALLPGRMNYDSPNYLFGKLMFHALTGLMVASVWAICFRQKIEQRRISLWALFILIAMEALLFAAIKEFQSY